jgi:hypothetical protein
MTRNVANLEEAAERTQAAINEINPDSDAGDDMDDQMEREFMRLSNTLRRTR